VSAIADDETGIRQGDMDRRHLLASHHGTGQIDNAMLQRYPVNIDRIDRHVGGYRSSHVVTLICRFFFAVSASQKSAISRRQVFSNTLPASGKKE